MQINENQGQYLTVKAGIRTLGPNGIEEITVDKNIDVCPDSPQELIDEVTETIFKRISENDFNIKINLPFVNAGGASLGANLQARLSPTNNMLYIIIERVDDISAGTIAGYAVDFSSRKTAYNFSAQQNLKETN